MKRTKTILYSRLLLFVLACLGVLLEIIKYGIGMLMYYTVLSNILVVCFMGYLIVLMLRSDETVWNSQKILCLKAGVTMSIMITCVIYHVMLAPLADDFWRLENLLCHYIVPLFFLWDTLVFDKRQQYRWFDPILWAVIPLLYSIFAIFNGLVTKIPVPDTEESPFPYFFVNVTSYGWPYVLRMTAIICIAYIMSGYLLYISKTLSRHKVMALKTRLFTRARRPLR